MRPPAVLSTTVVVLPRAFRASTTALKAAVRADILVLQYAYFACSEHVWRCGALP